MEDQKEWGKLWGVIESGKSREENYNSKSTTSEMSNMIGVRFTLILLTLRFVT